LSPRSGGSLLGDKLNLKSSADLLRHALQWVIEER
jgi:hypothetical protein